MPTLGASTVFAVRVAVHPRTEIEARAASALAGHPDVELVGLVGKRPPGSWRGRMVEVPDASGFEVAIGLDDREGAGTAVPVTAGPAPDDGPCVSGADPAGLGRALARGLAGASIARTIAGDRVREGALVGFPAPIGFARASTVDDGVLLVPVEGPVWGVAVWTDDGGLAVVDDGRFLAAVCLAAGVFVADRALDGPVPVWDHADTYRTACESLGLVVAESVSEG